MIDDAAIMIGIFISIVLYFRPTKMIPALVVLVAAGSVGLVDWVVDTAGVVVDQADGVADDSVVAVEVADLVDPIDDLVVPADLVGPVRK